MKKNNRSFLLLAVLLLAGCTSTPASSTVPTTGDSSSNTIGTSTTGSVTTNTPTTMTPTTDTPTTSTTATPTTDSSTSTITPTTNVTTSTTTTVPDTDDLTISISDGKFVYQNISATSAFDGYHEFETNRVRLGSNSNNGVLNFEFSKSFMVKNISIHAAPFNSTTSLTVDINDKAVSYSSSVSSETTLSKDIDSVLLSKLSITAPGGKSGRVYIYGISFTLGDPIAVTGIEKLQAKNVTVNEFVNIEDTYKILPENATNQEVTLTSTDENVVILDNKVKCLTIGNHNVKVTTVEGNHSVDIVLNAVNEVVYDQYSQINQTKFTYLDVAQADGSLSYIPSVGSPNILVVPVNFKDISVYNFNDAASMNKLDALFNGTKEDNSNDYYESVKSFYYKSSYGKLDMNFVLTDVFTPSFTSSTFVSRENSQSEEAGGTYDLIEEFYASGKIDGTKINFNDIKYDIDRDGYVDGVWFVYNDNRSSTQNNYWPYVYWYFPTSQTSNINISNYANCSVYFSFEDSNLGLDGHTFFHETGHLLGLDDYYLYDSDGTSAMGGLDMMDYNIGDHNAFSKFALGWTKPYLVNGNSTITLNPFESTGDSVIIPATYFNQSAFGEYIIIEYYTPTGLNKLDSENRYPNRNLYFTQEGIRMFHVDARLIQVNGNYYGNYLPASATSIPTGTDTTYYTVAHSNTPSYSYDSKNFLIETITRDNRKTYLGSEASNSSLFVEGDVLTSTSHNNFFKNGKFNDSTEFNFRIEIKELSNGTCKLVITK